MNIDQTFLINKINQLSERVSLLERKIQQYECNNLHNNNILQENAINKKVEDMFISKKNEEENKIYDPLSIDYIVKKTDNINRKNVLFNNNNNFNIKRVVETQDKIYDPLSN
jgi:hypothetical protein